MAARWYMFCLAAAAGLLLPVPFFLSVSETLQVVNRIESSKPLKMVKEATLSTVFYLTGNCPAFDAVGEVTLCLGAEANDSANHQVWDQAAWVTKHVLMRTIDDAFEVKISSKHALHIQQPRGLGTGKFEFPHRALT